MFTSLNGMVFWTPSLQYPGNFSLGLILNSSLAWKGFTSSAVPYMSCDCVWIQGQEAGEQRKKAMGLNPDLLRPQLLWSERTSKCSPNLHAAAPPWGYLGAKAERMNKRSTGDFPTFTKLYESTTYFLGQRVKSSPEVLSLQSQYRIPGFKGQMSPDWAILKEKIMGNLQLVW